MDENIELAIKNSGWSLCTWKSKGDDTCATCDQDIPNGENVYCESLSEDYEYHCQTCAIELPERMQKAADSWAEYAQENNLI